MLGNNFVAKIKIYLLTIMISSILFKGLVRVKMILQFLFLNELIKIYLIISQTHIEKVIEFLCHTYFT